MNDLALTLLTESLLAADTPSSTTLWVLDENISATDVTHVSHRVSTALSLLANRFDLHQQLADKRVDCTFSDFDFSAIADNSIDRLFYRVSKEKAIVHHIINQAFRVLKPGGALVIAGYKNDGIKTYIDKACTYFAGHSDKAKGKQSSHLATIYKSESAPGHCLDDKDYPQLREMPQHQPPFYSKPGQFGWNKVDKGSEFLIQELPRLLDGLHNPPATLLDLGCGYGYLSMMAATLAPFQQITATDNNAAAIVSCTENLKHSNVPYEVIADDCAQSIRGRYDLVLCNPPFHQGFAIESDLTQRFLEQTHKHLHAKGNAVFVVNQFIPLERKARELFGTVSILAKNKSFTLIHCKR